MRQAPLGLVMQPSSPGVCPHPLLADARIVLGSDGDAYLITDAVGHAQALRIRSRAFKQFCVDQARILGMPIPKRNEMAEIEHLAIAHAESSIERADVWTRVARIDGGVEIDVGDAERTRVQITADGVKEVSSSDTVFCRPLHAKPLSRPQGPADLERLFQHLPGSNGMRYLLVAWVTYTIAHPKDELTRYVILVLTGGQGCGKTSTTKLLQRLIDPHVVGAQVLPATVKDLAIATKAAHLVLFDNLRALSPTMADALCIASTGGALAARQLYTDGDQHVVALHGAMILNGLHAFVDQPDLAQRCMQLHLPKIEDGARRSERDIETDLQRDLPQIMAGLYDLTSKVLKAMPTAEGKVSHRMIDFVRWLAAVETVMQTPFLQDLFVNLQAEGQREALQENLLAATLLQFAGEIGGRWSGTPSELLDALRRKVSLPDQRSREWPSNPIALSKRLVPLIPAFAEQGIVIELSRGAERQISITLSGAF